MKKITQLDDLKGFKTGTIQNMNQFYEVLKANVAPSTYNAILAQISGDEALQEAMRSFSFSKGKTYAQALQHLNKNASENQPIYKLSNQTSIVRPLTFKENMEARLENNELFDNYLDSCTSIAYKKGSKLVKLNPISEELIMLPSDFNNASLDINYKQAVGEELDTGKVSKQDLWLAAMGGNNSENRDLYDTYKETLHQRTGVAKDNLMNFWTIDNPSKDQLRAVYQGYGDGSNADGLNVLYSIARLLQVD